MAEAVKRSRTAQGVAAERALLSDLGVLDDPFARCMLTPSMGAVLWVAQRARRVTARSVTLAGLAARVLWFDAQSIAALDAGIDQVAVVGAGYDSRAWRLRREGVQFFELDHPATQRDKSRRAPPSGPVYVEADLGSQGAGAALVAHGLDASRPVFFIVEGVTMYLAEEIVRRQLTELAMSSAVGSRLAVDFFPPRDSGTAQHRRQQQLQRLARVGSGEGIALGIDRSAAIALVTASGWDVDEATGVREAARGLVAPESGLPVNSINEHKTLIAASRPRGATTTAG